MRSNDIQDDLADGFEPARVPPVGPDGAVRLPPMRPAVPPPPRLCEQGPCVHYHRFTIQLDAEQARAAAVAGPGESHGALVGTGGQDFHVETHHYCYPTPGVESRLGSLPIVQCNRWTPKTYQESLAASLRGDEFLDSFEGKRYLTEQAAWNAARAAEQAAQDADTAEAERLMTEMAELERLTAPTPTIATPSKEPK
jgi:hypothetical protein